MKRYLLYLKHKEVEFQFLIAFNFFKINWIVDYNIFISYFCSWKQWTEYF
jgi:hypothetical protein